MDTIVRLENDDIFDMSEKNAQGIINSLNKKKIYTVGDLINAPDESLPFQGKEHFYHALRSVIKNKYLGGRFELADIITKSYPNMDRYPGENRRERFFKLDASRLGLVLVSTEDELFKRETFTMDDALKRDYIIRDPKGVHLKDYYLKYLEKKNKKNPDYMDLETFRYIEYLKEQLPKKIERKKLLEEYIGVIEGHLEKLALVEESSPMYKTAQAVIEKYTERLKPLIEERDQLEIDIDVANKRIASLNEYKEEPISFGTK